MADPSMSAAPAADRRLSLLQSVADVAGRMRMAQRSYFSTRAPDALDRARALERELDRLLESLHEAPGLYGSPNPETSDG